MLRRVRAPSAALIARYAALVLVDLACTRGGAPPASGPSPNADIRVVRVSLGTMPTVLVSATDDWRITDGDANVVARGRSGDRISVSAAGGVIRLVQPGGSTRELSSRLSLVAASPTATISVNQRRYRGELSIVGADSGVQIVNRLSVEAYLRGVVPRELGVRGSSDRAALEAQAVAARSYAIARLGNTSRAFDVTSTTSDQVYGGVDAEYALADAAVAATSGLVLMYDGRVVSAPYFSTCGGSTAAPDEIWRERGEPFLQRVSDRIPGSDRFYCDIAPRFRWERSWQGDTLTAIVERYLRTYATVPAGPVGRVRDVSIDGRTPSGRVAAIRVETDRGRYRVRGNDIRYVLRSPGGELLNSTYFSAEVVSAPDGRLARLTTRGLGYGHGVGLCQWGAIGRARAGQDFRTILRTYFPGTSIARAY
jgi:stage II sporulation protein D (peptidoglycan lytic transglycosylase)